MGLHEWAFISGHLRGAGVDTEKIWWPYNKAQKRVKTNNNGPHIIFQTLRRF